MKILIKNGKVVTSEKIEEADVLIEGKVIKQVEKRISVNADKEIDAQGKYIFPGLIDLHTHLRTPGREDEEDFQTGSQAAAKGGFTTIFCMPNTTPAIDHEGIAMWVYEQGQSVGIVDIYPIAAITKAREGKNLTEFTTLRNAKVRALSDDGNSVESSLVMRRALEYAKMEKLLVISHCEDLSLAAKGAMREGIISSKYGISPIPAIAESIIVNRDIEIARFVNAPLHIAHVSTAESVESIRQAKKQGAAVTAETCPHYFTLTVDDIEKNGFNANFKVNPPLGVESDRQAIIQALKEGVIDCIATDHAPHSLSEKELPFEDAPFGFIGLEFAFSLTYTYLVKEKILSLSDLVKKMSVNPAKIMRFNDRGEIREGMVADLFIADLDKQWVVDSEKIVSKSKNTPFLGGTLDAVVEQTFHQGKLVYNIKQ